MGERSLTVILNTGALNPKNSLIVGELIVICGIASLKTDTSTNPI